MKYFKQLIFSVFSIIISSASMAQLPPESNWSTPQIPHPSVLNNPAYLGTIQDAYYDTDFTKISDASLGGSGAGIQHQYAKVQAWNSDMTFIALGFDIIINADDYSLYKTFSPGLSDARWSNVNPNIRYYGAGDFLKKVDVVTDVVTTLHEFTGYGTCTIGPWEGNLSADDRYVVVTSQSETNASLYDIENDVVLATKNFPNGFDWASITPWGNYIAVSNNGTTNTELYDLNFNFVKILSSSQSHADFAIDTDGNQVLVEMCPLRMVRLDNLQETDLLPATTYTNGTCGDATNNPYICGHVSARSFSSPGWVLISAGIDDCNNGYNGYYHRTEIFLLKLDGTGTVKHFGFSRSSYDTYLSQAKASISPDGQKVIFTSDWNINGNGGSTVDYIVEYNDPAGVTYDLTTTISAGQGSVSPSSGTYNGGSSVVLTATADAGFVFSHWGGDLSGNTNPATVVMNSDKNITATFISSTLLAYWTMDEESGSVADDSAINELDATLNSTNASSYSTGILNGALYVDGSSQDGIVSNANLLAPSSFTIAAYVKIDPTLNQRGWIAAHGDNMGLFIENSGEVVVYFYNGASWDNVAATEDLRDGQWHHVAGTFDAATTVLKIYEDGVLKGTSTTNTTVDYSIGNDFTIGSMREGGETRFLKGDIDELRVYDKALNFTEVQALLIGVLAVESHYFRGVTRKDGVLLSWETGVEINNEGFEIQHSADGRNWEEIGFVKGKEIINATNNYRFFHKKPNFGTNYYRLKQIDFDGAVTYSKIITVPYKNLFLNPYPNPTSGEIYLDKSNQTQKIYYEVFNQLGKRLKSGEIGNNKIDISTLPKGVYLLKMQVASGVSAFNIVKI